MLAAINEEAAAKACPERSRRAAQEYSPGRKPWVEVGNDKALNGRKKAWRIQEAFVPDRLAA